MRESRSFGMGVGLVVGALLLAAVAPLLHGPDRNLVAYHSAKRAGVLTPALLTAPEHDVR